MAKSAMDSALTVPVTDAQPIIVVETKQPDDSDIPDEIKAELTFDGNTGDPIYYLCTVQPPTRVFSEICSPFFLQGESFAQTRGGASLAL